MISNTLVRELRRSIARHKYEFDDQGGLYLPEAKSTITAGGIFGTSLNDGAWQPAPNLLPTQGRNSILDIALGNVAKETNWYFAPFATNTAPTSALTAANFDATQTEFDNYDEVTRALWTPDAASNGVKSNVGTPVSITIGSATGPTNVNIYGLALISSSTKSGTGGRLAACALLPAARENLQDNDILGLRYTITLTST